MNKLGLEVPLLLAMLIGPLAGCGSGFQATGAGANRTVQPGEAVLARDEAKSTAKKPEPEEISVPDPSPSEPVKASMRFRPESVAPGTRVELLVALRVAGAHYIHAAGGPESPFTPLEIEATLPTG